MTVYLLRCADGTLYAGSTVDLPRRLRQHNGTIAGGARYTASRRPVTLAWSRRCPGLREARREEARIKRLTRAQKLRLIEGARA